MDGCGRVDGWMDGWIDLFIFIADMPTIPLLAELFRVSAIPHGISNSAFPSVQRNVSFFRLVSTHL